MMKIIELDGEMIWFGKWLFIHSPDKGLERAKYLQNERERARSMNRTESFSTSIMCREEAFTGTESRLSFFLMASNISSSINLLTFNAKSFSPPSRHYRKGQQPEKKKREN
jgi:hypothetical protein